MEFPRMCAQNNKRHVIEPENVFIGLLVRLQVNGASLIDTITNTKGGKNHEFCRRDDDDDDDDAARYSPARDGFSPRW